MDSTIKSLEWITETVLEQVSPAAFARSFHSPFTVSVPRTPSRNRTYALWLRKPAFFPLNYRGLILCYRVPHTGFEPVTFAVREQRPEPTRPMRLVILRGD